MDVVGEAGVLLRAVDAGFTAELKAKVEAASLQAKSSVPISADAKTLDAELAKIEARVKTAALKARSDVLIGADSKRLDAELVRIDASVKAAVLKAKSDVNVGVDAQRLDAELLAVETKVKAAVKASEAKIPLGLNTSEAEASVGRLQGVVGNFVSFARTKMESFAGSNNLVTRSLKEIETAGLASTEALKVGVVGGALAVTAAFAAMAVAGVKHFQDAAAQVRSLKATLGSTAEEASGLRNVAVALGVDVDALGRGMFKLGGILEKAGGDLAGVHVEVARNREGNTDLVATLDNMRAAYQSITDPVQKNQFALEAFKKTGLELRPILSANNEEFERFKKSGPILTDTDLRQSREYAIAQRELGEAFAKLEIDLARGLVPALTSVEHSFTAITGFADRVHVPIVQVTLAVTAAALGIKALTGAVEVEATAAVAATEANIALAASETGVGAGAAAGAVGNVALAASETAVGVGAVSAVGGLAGLRASLGVLGSASLGQIALLIGLTAGAKAAADSTVQLTQEERHRTGVLGVLDKVLDAHIGHKKDSTKADKENSLATREQVATAQEYGVALDAVEIKTGKLAPETQKAIDAAKKHAETMRDTAASIGLSSEALAAAVGFGTKVGADGFKAEEEAAKAYADAVTKAGEATRTAFSKDFSLSDTFSATNIAAEAKKQQDAVNKLADAQQHLTDVQAKLAESNQTTTAESISLRDAQEKVADVTGRTTKTTAEAATKSKDLADAQQRLSDVQQKLNEKGDLTVSQQNELRDAYAKVADAQAAVGTETQLSTKLLDDQSGSFGAAKEALKSLVAEAGNLSPVQRQIANFYESSLLEAKAFSDNIRTAIQEGYDPALINELLQKGPKEAGPLLQELVNDHSGRLRDMVNASQTALNDITELAVVNARLMQKAISAPTDQWAKDLKNALALTQAEAAAGGKLTSQALADNLGLNPETVRRIVTEFGITVRPGLEGEAKAAGEGATGALKDSLGRSEAEVRGIADRDTAAFQIGLNPLIPFARDIGVGVRGAWNSASEPMVGDTDNRVQRLAAAMHSSMDPLPGFSDATANGIASALALGLDPLAPNTADRTGRAADALRSAIAPLPEDAANAAWRTVNGWLEQLARGEGGTDEKTSAWARSLLGILNPILAGVGAPEVHFGGAKGGIEHDFAAGGVLARDSEFRAPGTLVQWAEPETEGEYHAFIPRSGAKRDNAKKVLGVAAKDLGMELRPREFADGGVLEAPPDLAEFGSMVGYTADQGNQFTYTKVKDWIAAHMSKGGAYGYQALIDYINRLGIENTVTSTTGGTHVEGSLHYLGLAADFVGDMMGIAKAFVNIAPSMKELFHDPLGFSVKNGERVGWTLGDHWDHVHAASWAGPNEGPGIPTGFGAYSGAAVDWINQALAIDGEPQSWFQGVYDRMMQESEGQNIPQQIHDVNTDLGTPAYGPMQIIKPTFDAYAAPGHYDWYNPVDSTAAAVNYIAARYGDPYHLPAGGYAAGGILGPTGDPIHVGMLDSGGTIYPGWNLNYNGTGGPELVPPPSVATHHDGVNVSLTIQNMSFGPGTDAASLTRTINEMLAPALAKALEDSVARGELGRVMHDRRVSYQ